MAAGPCASTSPIRPRISSSSTSTCRRRTGCRSCAISRPARRFRSSCSPPRRAPSIEWSGSNWGRTITCQNLRTARARRSRALGAARVQGPLATALAAAPKRDEGRRIRFGTKWLELDGLRLSDDDGVAQALTRSEFDLLKAFADNPKRALSRERLLDLADARDPMRSTAPSTCGSTGFARRSSPIPPIRDTSAPCGAWAMCSGPTATDLLRLNIASGPTGTQHFSAGTGRHAIMTARRLPISVAETKAESPRGHAMPHFSDDLSAEDPETLRRLRTLLHGQTHAHKRLPTLDERFGVAAHGGRGTEQARTAPAPIKQPRRARRPATT